MQHVTLSTPQSRLRYCVDGGCRPPRVFLTGMGLSCVATFVGSLSAVDDRGALFLDTLGSGYSDAPTDFAYTLVDHADTVAAALRQLDLARAEVIGFSMGGSIAVVLADRHPGLVGRLVVAEANLDQGAGTLSPMIAAYSEPDFIDHGHRDVLDHLQNVADDDPGVDAVITFLSRAPSYALHRNACALVDPLTPTVRQRLESLSIPKVYIAGGRDDGEYPGPGGKLNTTPVLTVPGAGHLMMWDDPAGWTAALAQAFSKVGSGV